MRTPKYRRHSLRDFGFVEVQGKRIPLPGRYNSAESKRAYHELCARLQKAEQGPPPLPQFVDAGMLIVEAKLAYLDHAFEGSDKDAPGGRYQNAKYALEYLEKYFGSLEVADFGPKRLDEFVSYLKTEPRKNRFGKPYADGRKISRNYINVVTFYVRNMFKWLVRKELIAASAHHALKAVPLLSYGEARETPKRQPVLSEHFFATLRHVNHEVRGLMLLQWHTGARAGSVCRATPAQFDTTKTPWEWKPRHKTEFRGKELTLYIGPQCRRILKTYLKDRGPSEFLFSPQRAPRPNVQNRERYTTGSYGQAIEYAIAKANKEAAASGSAAEPIPHWTPHMIRHAKGHSVREQYGAEAVQSTLGHESLKSAEIYSAKQVRLGKQVAEETG